jgi:putative transposase
VTRLLIRPGVSNDNTYIESWFVTVKSCQHYPEAFDCLAHAGKWAAGWVERVHLHHRHAGITGYTPARLHDGTWTTVARAREARLEAHY